jgi:hypothetical protein
MVSKMPKANKKLAPRNSALVVLSALDRPTRLTRKASKANRHRAGTTRLKTVVTTHQILRWLDSILLDPHPSKASSCTSHTHNKANKVVDTHTTTRTMALLIMLLTWTNTVTMGNSKEAMVVSVGREGCMANLTIMECPHKHLSTSTLPLPPTLVVLDSPMVVTAHSLEVSENTADQYHQLHTLNLPPQQALEDLEELFLTRSADPKVATRARILRMDSKEVNRVLMKALWSRSVLKRAVVPARLRSAFNLDVQDPRQTRQELDRDLSNRTSKVSVVTQVTSTRARATSMAV